MKRFYRILMLGVVLSLIVGCAAYGPAVVPNGVIRSIDASGKGDPAAYRAYTIYGADKNGMNTATTVLVKETPSLPGQPAKSDIAYAQSAAQTGINKVLVEQIIPAAATVAQGTVPGILISNAYRDAAKTLGRATANAAKVQGADAAKILADGNVAATKLATDPTNPANLPSTQTINNLNYQQQLQQQRQLQQQTTGVNVQ